MLLSFRLSDWPRASRAVALLIANADRVLRLLLTRTANKPKTIWNKMREMLVAWERCA